MEILKWLGSFVTMTVIIMMNFVLGGVEVYTESFGWGLLVSMVSGFLITMYFKEAGYL